MQTCLPMINILGQEQGVLKLEPSVINQVAFLIINGHKLGYERHLLIIYNTDNVNKKTSIKVGS